MVPRPGCAGARGDQETLHPGPTPAHTGWPRVPSWLTPGPGQPGLAPDLSWLARHCWPSVGCHTATTLPRTQFCCGNLQSPISDAETIRPECGTAQSPHMEASTLTARHQTAGKGHFGTERHPSCLLHKVLKSIREFFISFHSEQPPVNHLRITLLPVF